MRVYLDTLIIRALVSPSREEQTAARDQISKLSLRSHIVLVPQIVLGEALGTLMRDYSAQPERGRVVLTKLHEKLTNLMDMVESFPSLDMKVLECAQILKSKDDFLKDTDILVVAQTLVDPDSERLITSDATIIDSNAIRELERTMRDDGQRNVEFRPVDSLN